MLLYCSTVSLSVGIGGGVQVLVGPAAVMVFVVCCYVRRLGVVVI